MDITLIYMQNKTIERYNMITRSNRKNSTEKTEERKNRFSGESIMLTKEEAIIHDRLFINELAATLEDKAAGVDGTSKLWDKVRKDINYFRQHNAEAYMVLLDYHQPFCLGPNGPRHVIQVPWIPIQLHYSN